MSIKQTFSKITDQWLAKIICLVVAIFLYVFHQVSLIDKKTFAIPLTVVENGIVMHVGDYPSSVSVVIRASNNNMKLVSVNDIKAIVNLDTITKKGVYKLPVHIKLSDQLMTLDPFEIKLKDEYITIEVDRKSVKYVELQPSLIGEVGHGYEISKVELNPSTVLVTGPEAILNTTEKVNTAKINVSNAETTFTVETEYLEMTKLYEVDNKGPYKATVIVIPSEMEKDFTQVPVELINLPENLMIEGQNPVVSIKLSGKVVILEKYNLSKHAVQVDLSEIEQPGTYELPLIYTIPNNLRMERNSGEKIKINLIEKVEETEE